MRSLHERYADRGLQILAVNAWDEDASTVSAFASKERLPYTILMYGRDVFGGPYQGECVPHTYLLDRSGKIRRSHVGWDDDDEKTMADWIEELLAESETAPAS